MGDVGAGHAQIIYNDLQIFAIRLKYHPPQNPYICHLGPDCISAIFNRANPFRRVCLFAFS
jgi:hypothetical protein